MINDLFADLASTCYENNLTFEYGSHVGCLEIKHIDDRLNVESISSGYLKNWDYEDPESVLNRMLKEVNEYLEGK
ncbi:hypothetical protein KK120_08930 [Virgibacillus dakarensis]|nr:hypothetical protein [Virgibacillus dakarensis]MBT2215946.1 hypothetical protein [Virgibacillus dakarensis]